MTRGTICGDDLLQRTMALCRDWTVPILLEISTGLHGIALARTGHLAEGISTLREGRRRAEEAIGTGHYNTLNILWLGEAYARAQQYENAREAARLALALTREFNHWTYEGWSLRLLGAIACEAEPFEPGAAGDHYREALALAQKRGMRPLAAHCSAGLAKVLRRGGQRTEADAHQRDASAMYREMGMAYWLEKLEAEMNESP